MLEILFKYRQGLKKHDQGCHVYMLYPGCHVLIMNKDPVQARLIENLGMFIFIMCQCDHIFELISHYSYNFLIVFKFYKY
jgi:hypothetical protein